MHSSRLRNRLHRSQTNVLLPDGSRRILDVTGLDDATLIGAPKTMIQGTISDLRIKDGMILDQVAAEERLAYTDENGKLRTIQVGDVLEINDHRVVVVGIAKMKRTFTMMAMGFTTYSRSVQLMPAERRSLSYILLKAKAGADKQAIVRQIKEKLNLAAYTAEDFKKVTRAYWDQATGIPINFGIAIGMGFIIGIAVARQTFYGFVRDNMKQYGTLKAMGVRNKTLIKMVLLQASIVGVIGYGLGVGITAIFGSVMGEGKLAFFMPPGLLLFSGSGIAIIVLFSALLAMRTVIRVEPAVVFRS